MDLLFILRDALGSSIAGGFAAATAAAKAGRKVGVLVTQEALAGLTVGSLRWPRELSGQDVRFLLADRASSVGLPVLGKGEARQLDVRAIVAQACEAGVSVYACPIWASLLNLDGKLPKGFQTLDPARLVDCLQSAGQVIGTL